MAVLFCNIHGACGPVAELQRLPIELHRMCVLFTTLGGELARFFEGVRVLAPDTMHRPHVAKPFVRVQLFVCNHVVTVLAGPWHGTLRAGSGVKTIAQLVRKNPRHTAAARARNHSALAEFCAVLRQMLTLYLLATVSAADQRARADFVMDFHLILGKILAAALAARHQSRFPVVCADKSPVYCRKEAQ